MRATSFGVKRNDKRRETTLRVQFVVFTACSGKSTKTEQHEKKG
jgi:hypothetical protein